MKMEMDINRLTKHVNKQLSAFFDGELTIAHVDAALKRAELCFQASNNKRYRDNDTKETLFSPLHSGQYSIFLYYLSNALHTSFGNDPLAAQVYYLNKIMHSVDWFYEIELPEYWGVEHPIGSVLGRAHYNNGLFIYQSCTVGGNGGQYPVLGKNVIMYANSTILGDSHIGNNVLVSTGTTIKDQNIPDNCMVFGSTPHLTIKQKSEAYILNRISAIWNKL